MWFESYSDCLADLHQLNLLIWNSTENGRSILIQDILHYNKLTINRHRTSKTILNRIKQLVITSLFNQRFKWNGRSNHLCSSSYSWFFDQIFQFCLLYFEVFLCLFYFVNCNIAFNDALVELLDFFDLLVDLLFLIRNLISTDNNLWWFTYNWNLICLTIFFSTPH